jgi:hypothetical protein
MFGDSLDRLMFYMEMLGVEKFKNAYGRIEQMEADCYFVGCFVWLQFHVRMLVGGWRDSQYAQRKARVLKIVKYLIDSVTSYCKFSHRVWELDPKYAAVLGITSSLIGLY